MKNSAPVVMFAALRLIAVFPILCLAAPQSLADESEVQDVTIWWSPWYRGDPGPIHLFVNGVLVGSDRDGMDAVLDVVRKLPRGTSVVWGPDIKKAWSGPGGESTVPRAFPDRWGTFQEVTRANGLVVSSSFYRGFSGPSMSAVAKVVSEGSPRGPDDVLVRWEFVPPNSLDVFVDEKLVGRDAEGLLAVKKLLETILVDRTVRFVLANDRPRGRDLKESFSWDALVDGTFRSTLAEVIQRRNLRVFIEKPEQFLLPAEKTAHRVNFSWANYDYFKETPHDQVVYIIDEKVMGIGDAGIDGVLASLRDRPEGTLLAMPQFSTSKFVRSVDQDRVPFPTRRAEFDEIVKSKHFELNYDRTVPQSNYESDSIALMLSLGRVVRDNQGAKNADLILSWKNYAPTNRKADAEEGIYTLNGEEVGKGMSGYLAAIRKIEALPKGAVLRLDPVCIRTTGPFPCPIMLRGQRHFARTGREPYHTLLVLLSEVVTRNKLQVELIPDEGKAETSCIAK